MFIERVRALLKEKGIPAKVMLQDLEINKNQLTRWEKDGAIPNKALLIAIANYLDTTVEYLTGESDEKESSVGITVSLTSEESALIESYRNSPENVRKAVKALLDLGD